MSSTKFVFDKPNNGGNAATRIGVWDMRDTTVDVFLHGFVFFFGTWIVGAVVIGCLVTVVLFEQGRCLYFGK